MQPATAAGNYACYGAHTGAEAMKARCCAAGTEACVSVAVSAAGGGCAKRNDDGGWLNQTGYVDYRVKAGHAQAVTGPPKRICADLNDPFRGAFQITPSSQQLYLIREVIDRTLVYGDLVPQPPAPVLESPYQKKRGAGQRAASRAAPSTMFPN